MLIDWFTVIAQAVNFIILVVLLKIFLYDRIIQAMDERQQRIDDQLAEARETREKYERELDGVEQDRRDLEKRREGLVKQAEQEAGERRKKLIDEAREEVDKLRRGWRASLARDRDRFLREVSETLGREAGELCRKALSDLADADLEEQAAAVFLARLGELDASERDELARAAEKEGRVLVQSGRELTSDVRQRITTAVHESLGQQTGVEYEVRGEGVGLVLQAGGRRLAWDLDAWLEEVSRRMEELLDETLEHQSGQQPDRKPDQENAHG